MRISDWGSDVCSSDLLDVFRSKGVTIRQQYGFTEGCAGVSSPSIEVAARFPASCGESLPGIELRICDEHGRPTPDGEVGEVFARGPQLMEIGRASCTERGCQYE